MVSFSLVTGIGDPLSYGYATSRTNEDKYLLAMLEEIESLQKNKTWELVKLTKGKKVVSCNWVFRQEALLEQGGENFKARLVTKGYSQKKRVD